PRLFGLGCVAVLRNELREQPLPHDFAVARMLPRAARRFDVPALRGRLRVPTRAGAERKGAGHGERGAQPVHLAPPRPSRCEKARSADSQNVRHAAYSAGLMRVFRMATIDLRMTLPPEDSALTENAPKGVSSCIGSGRLFTLRAGGRWMTTS